MTTYDTLVLLSAFGFWALFVRGLFRSIKNSEEKRIAHYRNTAAAAHKVIHDLKMKTDIFHQYDQTYVVTLMKCGFGELGAFYTSLNEVMTVVESLYQQNEILEATQIAEWILDQRKLAPDIKRVPYTIQNDLEDWQERSRHILIKCADGVAEVAEENINLGIIRPKRNRRPTLVNMQELRRWITPH